MTQFLYNPARLRKQDLDSTFFSTPASERPTAMTHIDDHAGPASDHPVYAISVAAELTGVAVQSIRLWERRGLLTPARSAGGTRRYSADDLSRIARITTLVD